MSNKKVTVILTNYESGTTKPTKIKMGYLTWQQKEYLIPRIIPVCGFDDICSFNVHHDKLLTHVPANGDTTKTFIPTRPKNKSHEIIIEIIPDTKNNECRASNNNQCLLWIQSDCCQAYLFKTFLKKIMKTVTDKNQGR